MKLTKVFFLFIFSSTVLFVGAVDNVLSARIVDGPYFADATARRVQVANVLAHARVSCSNPHTINGYYSMYIWKDFDTDRQAVNWRIIDGTFNYVNGVFDEEMGGPIRLTEFGYKVDCTAEGDLSIAKFDVWDTEVVGEIPILEPTPTPNPEPQLGIFPIDPSDIPSPGERHGYILYTAEPYYYVSWYVKAPWDTSELGEYIEGDNGDGTATTATMYYTYPSGAMHTGDFLITAVIYRWSDMSQYEETYVATVVLE